MGESTLRGTRTERAAQKGVLFTPPPSLIPPIALRTANVKGAPRWRVIVTGLVDWWRTFAQRERPSRSWNKRAARRAIKRANERAERKRLRKGSGV